MMLGVLLGQGFTAEPKRKPAAFCIARTVALMLALSGFASVLRPANAFEAEGKTVRMLALVNDARAEAKLEALTTEPQLSAAACRHAQDLARGGPLSHRGSDGSDLAERVTHSGYRFAMAAENLAAGVPTPDETVWLWLGSPGHRRNILTAEFREAGIAHAVGAGGNVWVLVLATPQAHNGTPIRRAGERETIQVEDDIGLTCY